jgi:hypothetical protein
MSSKQVTDRQKISASVLAAQEAHTAPVAAEIQKLLSPFLKKGENLPDVALLADLAGRMLSRAQHDLVTADAAHEAELGDDAGPRKARDDARDALRDELTDLRDLLRGLFGVEALRGLGFSGETPEDPVVLERFAGEVLDALEKKPRPLPKRKGLKWDADDAVQTLKQLRGELHKHLADVAREAREAQATLTARNAAMDAFDDRYRRVVGFLDGLFRLGGQEALADRLRPAARKAALSNEETAAPKAEGGTG